MCMDIYKTWDFQTPESKPICDFIHITVEEKAAAQHSDKDRLSFLVPLYPAHSVPIPFVSTATGNSAVTFSYLRGFFFKQHWCQLSSTATEHSHLNKGENLN